MWEYGVRVKEVNKKKKEDKGGKCAIVPPLLRPLLLGH